jgi:hypothetical protein
MNAYGDLDKHEFQRRSMELVVQERQSKVCLRKGRDGQPRIPASSEASSPETPPIGTKVIVVEVDVHASGLRDEVNNLEEAAVM